MAWSRVSYVREPTIAEWEASGGTRLSIEKFLSRDFFGDQHEMGDPRYVYQVTGRKGGSETWLKDGSSDVFMQRTKAFRAARRYMKRGKPRRFKLHEREGGMFP